MNRRLSLALLGLAFFVAACAEPPPANNVIRKRVVIVYATEDGTWQVADDRLVVQKDIAGILGEDGVAEKATKLFKTKGVKAVVLLNCTRPKGSREHARWYSESEGRPQLVSTGFADGLDQFLVAQQLYEKRKGVEAPPPPPQ